MHGAVVPERDVAEFAAVLQVIVVAGEAGPAVDAALHDVLCHARQVEAGLVRHRGVRIGCLRFGGIAVAGCGAMARRRSE